MAKGSNPVDAHRKAQRKQELKKNKQKRETQREVSTVKTDLRRASSLCLSLDSHAPCRIERMLIAKGCAHSHRGRDPAPESRGAEGPAQQGGQGRAVASEG